MLIAWIWTAGIVAPVEYGKLNLMQTAITLLSGVAGLGLALAVTRQVAAVRTHHPEAAGRYVGSALVLTLLGGLAAAAPLLGAQAFFAGVLLHNRALDALVAVSAGAVVFSAVNSALQASLIGLEAFFEAALAQWGQGFAAAAGLVAGAAAGGARGSLVGFSIGQAIALVAGFSLLGRATASRGVTVSYRVKRTELRALWRYGLPTFGGSVAIAAAMLAAQVILSHQHHGYEQVGIFNLAYRWHLAILFVPAAVGPALVPVMTRHATGDAKRKVAQLFRSTIWGMVGLAALPALVIAVGAPLVLGASGDFYAEHPVPLIVLAAAAVPAAINNVLSSTSVSIGLVREWLLSDLVLAVVLVGVALALVDGMQSTGLAISYLSAYLATDIVLSAPLARRLRSEKPNR